MWTDAESRANKRAILAGNIDRDIARGKLRPHEREKAIDIAETIWQGHMGNGQATDAAVKLIQEGKA